MPSTSMSSRMGLSQGRRRDWLQDRVEALGGSVTITRRTGRVSVSGSLPLRR